MIGELSALWLLWACGWNESIDIDLLRDGDGCAREDWAVRKESAEVAEKSGGECPLLWIKLLKVIGGSVGGFVWGRGVARGGRVGWLLGSG